MAHLRLNRDGRTFTRVQTPAERHSHAEARLAKAREWESQGYDVRAFISHWENVRDAALDEMIDSEADLIEDWSSRRYRR